MTIQQAWDELHRLLCTIYAQREAANISDLVIEKATGKQRLERITARDFLLDNEQQTILRSITNDLLQNKPVQYAIGEAWFMNMKLMVNEKVLIPRPETEELVDWIVQEAEDKAHAILDIGTGSGCIAIALKKQLPQAEVSAIDVSEEALQVAKINATLQNVLIDVLYADILDEASWKQLAHYDVMVSNPPYITQNEQQAMNKNVLDYEPHFALFVPDNDPLLFYKAIADFAKTHLKPNGKIYVEINEALGNETVQVFATAGFGHVELRKDMQGKDRMLKAVKALNV